MFRLSPPYPATALWPNEAFWILCLPRFALVRRVVVPQVGDILPCCQIPFAGSSCAAAAATACRGSRVWVSAGGCCSPGLGCRNSPALCWEQHLPLPALPWNNCLDPCSRCWGAAAARWGRQLLPWAEEVGWSPGCWNGVSQRVSKPRSSCYSCWGQTTLQGI